MQTATSGSVKFSLEVIYHGAVYRVHSEITNMNLYIFSSIVLLPVRLCASAAVISIACHPYVIDVSSCPRTCNLSLTQGAVVDPNSFTYFFTTQLNSTQPEITDAGV